MLAQPLAVELGKAMEADGHRREPCCRGAVGAQAGQSPADGYTLLLASGSMFTVNQFIYNKLPYGP
jgi:hypothetical protein